MSAGGRESPLARWSRRKAEAGALAEAAEPEPAAATTEPAPVASVEPAPLTDADMPDVDSLGAESDFSPFMSPGVSDALRNRALRKLFTSAAFNLRDGLDDYDEEYTEFAKLGGVVTSDMKHRIAVEREKLRQRLAGEAGGEPGGPAAEPAAAAPGGPDAPDSAAATQADEDPPGDADEPTETAQLARHEPPPRARADD